MDVIIVSKTRMSTSACVGAVTGNGRFVRLLNEDGYNQDVNTSFNIGDVWTIDYQERPNKTAPHIEDILITNKKIRGTLKSELKMLQVIQKFGVKIWRGRPDVLFEGKLNWTNSGSGYINEENGICVNSVGFWISDRDLKKRIFYEKTRYSYPNIR